MSETLLNDLGSLSSKAAALKPRRKGNGRAEFLQRLGMIQHQARDTREQCQAAAVQCMKAGEDAAEAMRGHCRELYKLSRKAAAHNASIDAKIAAGRAFDWRTAMQNILMCGDSAFADCITSVNELNCLPDGFSFSDMWRYQVSAVPLNQQ